MHTPEKKSFTPKRNAEDYMHVTRFVSQNHFLTEEKKTTKPANNLSRFFSRAVFSWLYFYVKSRFGPKYKYPSYGHPETGIYKINNKNAKDGDAVTIAICSDWATDTQESFEIAAAMAGHNPDYTVHVGDTYYVGAPHEIKSNFLDAGAPWVWGTKGSFALLGNHEMYARGDAFFEWLLPALGMKDVHGKCKGQQAGYFCLENEHWRVLGLDTGYHSIGKPLLEFLPWFSPKCQLDDTLLHWLKEVVKIGNPEDKRGLLILTHHQYISAFNEGEYQTPATQLAELIGRKKNIVWIWGHEHKFSMYARTEISNGVAAYGRCIGHGGTPVELHSKSFKLNGKKRGAEKLVVADRRVRKILAKEEIGYNGYVMAELTGRSLRLNYHDQERLLLSEIWEVDATGEIYGKVEIPKDSILTCELTKAWDDLVNIRVKGGPNL